MRHLLIAPLSVILFFTLVLSACSGWKNLARNTRDVPIYEYHGDTIDHWSLVRQDSLWGYVSENGRRIVKHIFPWADDFSGHMALVQYKAGYTFVNQQGKLLRRMDAPRAYPFSEGLAAVQKDQKWGYIDVNGKWTIEPQFEWAFQFRNNRAGVAIGLRYGYINREGHVVIPPVYDEVNEFNGGIAIVRMTTNYGLIDTLGNERVEPRLKSITPWDSSLYLLETRDKKLGAAGPDGHIVLDTIYDEITWVRENYIRVKRDGLVGLFNRDGQAVIPLVYAFLGFISDEGLIAAKQDDKWGFLDTNGRVILPFEYEISNMGFRGGRSWVKKNGKLQLMNSNFEVIKEIPYDYAGYFNHGFAIVWNDDAGNYGGTLFGYIDDSGEEVISPQYHAAWPFNKHGLTIAGTRQQGISRHFLIHTSGETLPSERTYYDLNYFGNRLIYNRSGAEFTFLSPETGRKITGLPYAELYPLRYSDRTDLARVHDGSKIGLIDTTLSGLLPIRFDGVGEYIRHRLNIKKDSLWGFADENFRIRIPFRYDQVGSFRYGVAEVEKHGLKGVINAKGQAVVPLLYSDITVDYASNRIYAEKTHGYDMYDIWGRLLLTSDFSYLRGYWGTHYTVFRRGDKLGAIDFYLNVLTEPRYDRIGSFYDGLAWVVNNGKGGFVNKQFQVVIPLEWDYLEDYALGFTKTRKAGKDYYLDANGKEIFPDKVEIEKREAELQRRKDGFFEFSS